MKSYRDLIVWQKSMSWVTIVYSLTSKIPESEKFGLISQIRRSSVSIPSNIAEGVSRKGKKDQIHFLNISYASLMELVCQIQISQEVGYIDNENLKIFKQKANNLAVKMNNYTNYVKKLVE